LPHETGDAKVTPVHAPHHRLIPLALALLATATACSSAVPTGHSSPQAAASPQQSCESPTPSAEGTALNDVPQLSIAPANQTTTLSGTLTLKGQQPGEQVTATFLQVVDPACGIKGASKLHLSGLHPGHKYVGLKLRLVDSGQTPYEDAPSNSTWGYTDDGRQVGSYTDPVITAGPDIAPDVDLSLAPGQSATGFVIMEIAQNAHLTRINFTPDSGQASNTGEWKLN
jgi:hypothetical protein